MISTGIKSFLSFLFNFLPFCVSDFRKVEKLTIKIVSSKARLRFLKDCVEEKVIPRSFSWLMWISESNPFPEHAKAKLGNAIKDLKEEIDETYFQLRRAKRTLYEKIDNSCTWSEILKVLKQVSTKHKLSKEKELGDKLDRLISKSPWSKFSKIENVVNLSLVPLKKYQVDLLGYGINFSFPHEKHTLFNFIEHLEKNKKSTDGISYNCIFMNLDEIFQNLKNEFYDFVPKRFRLALKELKREKSLKICKADKGSKIVIMNKNDYESKMNLVLSDPYVYKKIKTNPLKKMQSAFNSGLNTICKQYNADMKYYISRLPSLPHIYGLPKIHKKDVPLRPIVSNINCPKYKLSKWLTKELSPLLGSFSNAHIKHNLNLLDRLKNINPSEQKFISFDVKSLYTNVPVKQTIDFIKRKLPQLKNINLKMPTDFYVELIELCLKNSFFRFENEFYEQVSGLAMGCPLSSFLANIFLEHVESEMLSSFDGISPSFWWRYVDDVLCLVPKTFELKKFLSFINNIYPTLNFTYEWEEKSKIPFLDILIHNCKTNLKFSVYRKPTNSES